MQNGSSLVGRQDEIGRLEGLTRSAAEGRGGVLVLRGEAGIGKSALLEQVSRAPGFLVLQASGSEFESELPFAALHQLCVPVLGRVDEMPEPLRVAFGQATGAPEMFRIGLAVLELLSGAARNRPVLCVIDDAHWLDDASTKALMFLARRIASEPVAMVFAARQGLDELPGMELEGLTDDEARGLLQSTLDPRVRDRILAESRGNPLALLELPRTDGFALPQSSVANRVERGFQARLAALPAQAQLLLTLASAEPTGDPALLWAAARKLGIAVDMSSAAEVSGLIEFGTRVRFCHPLARSAVYRAADATELHTVHRALAEVTDPVTDADRRAWHRAHAGAGPNEAVAAELEASASRAQARCGVAAAAAFLERSAALSLDPAKRTGRTLAAVRFTLEAGAVEAASNLLTTVDTSGLDDETLARVDLLRGQIAFSRHGDGDGPYFMLRAAQRLAALDPAWSRDCYLDALEMALAVGRASGVMDRVTHAAGTAPPAPAPPDILDALLTLTTQRHQAAAPLLRSVVTDVGVFSARPALATMVAAELWDIDAHNVITEWIMKTGRSSGSPVMLRLGRAQVASGAVHTGDFATAMSAIAEEEAIADAVGAPPMMYPRLHLAAIRGRRQEARELFDAAAAAADARGAGQLIANIHWARSVLANGLADYPAALAAAQQAAAGGDLFLAGIALPELIEAAVHCGRSTEAAAALAALTERTQPSGTVWAAGVTACARALVTGDEPAYLEAVDTFDGTRLAPYLARTELLYGEWLRRQNRKLDARQRLRSAHNRLSELGMEAFARRAADELRAAGAQAGSRSTRTHDELTMQEMHIARLVAAGATTKEVADRLFLSPRTIDAHLRNIFRKLGITSRRQLREVPDLKP
ncbi:AAA family ATPase [Nocardia sp. NBC_00508]|uniref:ATP-binding protein n=1 Tax=Nocardia sp. NBC_00508 TaxID=2975992 RepID=UPI002E7FCC41|nr:AAA family ATPase [Nocardia sp. NBC_00508]WUD66128.1 AAA family ATPase [Nocardia sp. NBC_00508]